MDVRPGPSSATSTRRRSFNSLTLDHSETSSVQRKHEMGSAAGGGRSRSLDVCASRTSGQAGHIPVTGEPPENANDTQHKFFTQHHSNVQMSPVPTTTTMCYSTLPISKAKQQPDRNMKQYKSSCGGTQPRKRRQQHYSSLL